MLPTQNDLIKKLNKMLAGLACINQSTKQEEVKSLKRQLAEDYRLSETTLSQIVATLEHDYHQEQITALQNEAKKREGWVGYYIKTTTNEGWDMSEKKGHINITVMVNHQGDLQVVVKPDGEREEGVTKNEGSFKRATNETMICFDGNGKLRVNKVVDIKTRRARYKLNKDQLSEGEIEEEREKRDNQNYNISKEVMAQDVNAFTCFFPTGGVSQGGKNRGGAVHTYQQNKGEDVFGLTFKEKNENNPVDVNYAMQYMLQIGAQLNGLHKQGISHHDVKLENILSHQVNGHPVLTLIDCPLEGETAAPIGSSGKKKGFAKTVGVSCPPHTHVDEIEDPDDPEKIVKIRTDYWSNGLYSSEDDEGDPQPEKDRIDKIWLQEGDEKSIATKYWESKKRYTGHVDDSYAYLRGLLKIAASISNTKEQEQARFALGKFASDQMKKLANQTLAYVEDDKQKSWPEKNLTVAKIQEEFAEYCKKEPSLQAAFNEAEVTAKQAGSGPDGGLRITIPKEGISGGEEEKRNMKRRTTRRVDRNTGRNRSTAVAGTAVAGTAVAGTAVAGANQPQSAVTVAMVLRKEEKNLLMKLWLLLLDCMTLSSGEGSRLASYNRIYSEFRLNGGYQEGQVNFGWKLIEQSLNNNRFIDGCVEFAQALIVAECSKKDGDIQSAIEERITSLTGSNTESFTSQFEKNKESFTSKLQKPQERNKISAAVKKMKELQANEASKKEKLQKSGYKVPLLEVAAADVAKMLRDKKYDCGRE